MFRPPINRAMRTLDRSFFQKKVPISAARIYNSQHISQCRKELEKSGDMLALERITTVRPDPTPDLASEGRRCLLLRPEIKHHDSSTWSQRVRELAQAERIGVIPYELHLEYDYWTYWDIMNAILPEDEQDEIPSGFNIVGHVAHLNLRDQYLQYKRLIADVLRDKNRNIKTVINKIDNVGEENEYRTFAYEVLAGPDDLNVEVKEGDCLFRFDYAKVYWNSRLNTEHRRLIDMFNAGDAVCDVMAGVGPFAVPAGKKGVFVWANDLNPDSCASLVDAVKRNKVDQFVRPFNEDGHTFIRSATASLLNTTHSVTIQPKHSRSASKAEKTDARGITPVQTIVQPRVFSHYVMNLPATAITFLPSFIGLYAAPTASRSSTAIHADEASQSEQGLAHLFAPHTTTKLPMIHVYCFSTKSADNRAQEIEICKELSRQLGLEGESEITPQTEEVSIFDVRDVAPKKRMFCASFRLPREVAFRRREC